MQFLLDGEDLWEIVNQDTASATASDPQSSRAQTRNRTRTLSPTPTPTEEKTKKAAYLIYQSCTAVLQSHIARSKKNPLYSRVNGNDEAGQALFEEF